MTVKFEELRKGGSFKGILNVLRFETATCAVEDICPNWADVQDQLGSVTPVVVSGSIHRVNGQGLWCPHHDRYADTLFVEVYGLADHLAYDPLLKPVSGAQTLLYGRLKAPVSEPVLVFPKTGPQKGFTKLVVTFASIEPLVDDHGVVIRGLQGDGDPVYYLSNWSVAGCYQPRNVNIPRPQQPQPRETSPGDQLPGAAVAVEA